MSVQKFKKIRLAFVRKYIKGCDNYISLEESLMHVAWNLNINLEKVYIDSEAEDMEKVLKEGNFDLVLVPGGFGIRGLEGKILAAKYARENNIPYLGICLGF